MEENKLGLEVCLSEFYDPQTSNGRKREIETLLQQFLKSSESWKQALFCYRTDSSDYVTMYCQTILEHTIKKYWTSMSHEDQNEIKCSLYSFLLQKASASSPVKCTGFIRNKTVKLICDIGKVSWPNDQPDFFSNVLQITQSSDTVVIGLWFLKTISEEWTTVGAEASTQRKVELKANLLKEIPNIFRALEVILTAGLSYKQERSTLNSSLEHINEVISLALDTSAHLCSWITLDGSLPSTFPSGQGQEVKVLPFPISFVHLLCHYALINFERCDQTCPMELSHAIRALNVLNELCYRKYIPKDFNKHMHYVTHFGIELLNKILSRPLTQQLPDAYLEKVIEFLCLIASSHFNQYDEQSAKALLSLLVTFTFGQSQPIFYYECLDIWGRILDHVNTHLPIMSQLMNREYYIEIYKQPTLALANGIVHSTAKYQILDSECVDLEDDEVETPSLTRNIDILVKVGELLPTESLESLLGTWTESCRYFGSLQGLLDPTSKNAMYITNKVEIEHFHFIVQLIGRMANVFYSDVFKQEVSLGKSIFQQLVGVYNFSQRFYFVKEPDIIVKMNCEIVSSLSLWTYWLQRFHSEVILADSTLEDQQMFFDILGFLTEVVFFAVDNRAEIDSSLVTSNLNFFLTLITSVRTQFIFQSSSVQALIQGINVLKSSTRPEVFRTLNKIVSSLLLLPWQSVSQQEWEVRTKLYENYMERLLEEFKHRSSDPLSVISHLNFIQDQLDLLVMENSQSRKICWKVLKEVVPFLHDLTKTFLRQPNVSESILSTFSKLMKVMRQQAGAAFFESTIQSLLALFSSANLINDLLQETEASAVVVERFLEMLQFIVKDPSPTFKEFLGGTLSICYNQIYPVIYHRSSSDLKISFFTLIRDTINYRWNYFFPPLLHQARTSACPNATERQHAEEGEIKSRLDQIIASIGTSFLHHDLDVFRYNLNTLTIWNESHNFYGKLSGSYCLQFTHVLLQILGEKRHDLYREEVIRVLHDLASVDYTQFRTTFVQGFLESNFSSIPLDQRTSLMSRFETAKQGQRSPENQDSGIDLPSFSFLMNGFVEDLRHFYFLVELRNESTPG